MNFSCKEEPFEFYTEPGWAGGVNRARWGDAVVEEISSGPGGFNRKSGGQPPHSKVLRWGGHGVEEFHIGLGFGEAAEQKLHGLDRRERAEHFAQNPNAAQLVGRKQEFVFTSAGALNIDGREHTLIGEAAIEIDFHVACALELFKDDVVHAAAGINQGGGDDGERAPLFDVAGGGKEAARALEGVSVNTAAEDFAGGRCDGVIGAREAGNGVEKNDDIALVLDEALGFFQDHFGNLDVALGRLIERGTDDFTLHCALHVRDFFRALVNQEHDQSN